jgi:arylsulfatase
MPDTRPNLLFINVDQWRTDCLGIKGHPVVETPYLDDLASQGVVFNRAYASCPTCIPARASILTGLSPRSHGRVGYKDGVPWNYSVTLPGELAKAGYHTQCVGKTHFHPTRNLCGFHNIVLHNGYLHHSKNYNQHYPLHDDYLVWLREKLGPDVDYIDSGLHCNSSWTARSWPFEERYHPTNWVVTESIDFLRRRDTSKPFFLSMSFVRPHAPLDPPQFYLDMYEKKDLPDPIQSEWGKKIEWGNDALKVDSWGGKVNEDSLRRARAAYYACLTHIDHQIGRFLIALREFNQNDNTLIIFTSDHGELLGDHQLFRKSLPYEGSAGIPFVVTPPSSWNWTASQKSDALIELRDILPTFLDAANVAIPKSIEGKSLIPLCRGKGRKIRDYIHGEHPYTHKLSNQWIVTGQWKYIWFSQTGLEQLFDLQNDPEEKHDLTQQPESSEVISKMRKLLIKELSGREEGYVKNGKLVVGRKPKSCLSHILKP